MKAIYDIDKIHYFEPKDLQKEIAKSLNNSILVLDDSKGILTYIVVYKRAIDDPITNSTTNMKKTKKVNKLKTAKTAVAKKAVKKAKKK